MRDAREYRLGNSGALELSSQCRQNPVGIIALAIDQAVRGSLETLAQRLKRNRDDGRGHERRLDPRAVEEALNESNYANIASNDRSGQQTVDERSIDDDVDVVEPVPQDSDGYSEGGQQRSRDLEHGRKRTFQRIADHEQRDAEHPHKDEPLHLLALDPARRPPAKDQRQSAESRRR